MQQYKISIVIPVYNNEKYIDECMSSLINQNIGFKNLQIILVNDGSIDGSLKVLKKYEQDNVIVIDKKNTGVSDTRNIGIKKALGKYILFLDSDDYLSLNACNDLYNFFEKHYDEIDLVTYPIVYNVAGKLREHNRYITVYDHGTGVYDLSSNYNIIQATVNIMIKNNFSKNPLFEVKQNFSEDERFATEILMKRQTIGFCKSAVYYYRRHVGTANDTITNPMYTFDVIMNYYEYLFKKYRKNGKVAKYIQSLYLNNLGWRIKQGDLLPLYLEDKEYNRAINRIKKLVKLIDTDVIMASDNLGFYHKFFLLDFVDRNIDVEYEDNQFKLFCDGLDIYDFDNIEGVVVKIKKLNHKLNIMGSLLNPLFSSTRKPKLFIKKVYSDRVDKEQIDVFLSNDSYNWSTFKTTTSYGFDISIDLKNLEKFQLFVELKDRLVPVDFRFKRFASNNFVVDDKNILYSQKSLSFKIRKSTIINRLKSRLRGFKTALTKKPAACLYRLMHYIYPTRKNVWLYIDRGDNVDNAYIQFLHDFDKNDGINRFYISSFNDKEIDKYFEDKHKKYIIKHCSLKHKMYYLKAKNILTSFIDLQVYCPFNSSVGYYKDIIKYNLIYLQHGILHANLIKMYSKEFTEIDKIVISTMFEESNLVNKYHYRKEDLIYSGMPRMSVKEKVSEPKNKILFAPSWRKYLIGNLINNKRKLKKKEFLESSFYKEIYSFLHSERLQKLLKDNSYELDFKLHPIFEGYADLFDLDNVDNVKFGGTDISEYKIFITDFSSFQFDFVKLKRPIIYFLPDMQEFKAGLHTYRKLDLDYKDAFGKLCLTDEELFKELNKIISKKATVPSKYLKRMETFFLDINDPCEEIYENVSDK